jgi:hypothetical protein
MNAAYAHLNEFLAVPGARELLVRTVNDLVQLGGGKRVDEHTVMNKLQAVALTAEKRAAECDEPQGELEVDSE